MSGPKYEIIQDETLVTPFGKILRRVRALRAIERFGIRAGEKGGWIEHEDNLSQDGAAWVFGDARVSGAARVSGDALVSGAAQVFGAAQVSGDARVFGDARVSGAAWVSGDARVSGDALVSGDARVSGDALVFGNAQVSGDALVFGNAQVSGDARVSGDAQILIVGPIGSRGATTTFFVDAKRGVMVATGCFCDTLEVFADAVDRHHGTSLHGEVYRAVIALARVKFAQATVVAQEAAKP